MKSALRLPDNQTETPLLQNNIATLPTAFAPAVFANLAQEIESLVETERSYLPVHKKGGTVAYSNLIENAPNIVAMYRSNAFLGLISKIIGTQVYVTPDHDESSCSVLFYEKAGDHIGWHYDHNFYSGRHFTVLVPVVNRRDAGGLSSARLVIKQRNQDIEVPTPPNKLIVFEGAKLLHMVKPISAGERRVVWSMTFCTDPRSSIMQDLARRIKDTAFFGVRALWS
jgi:2OG-Fe(II) oxygenase superfamily